MPDREFHKEVETLRIRVSELENQMFVDNQHNGHDLSRVIAEHNVLLMGRVFPLLSDAIDALEILPAEKGIALRRLRAVLSLIRDASKAP